MLPSAKDLCGVFESTCWEVQFSLSFYSIFPRILEPHVWFDGLHSLNNGDNASPSESQEFCYNAVGWGQILWNRVKDTTRFHSHCRKTVHCARSFCPHCWRNRVSNSTITDVKDRVKLKIGGKIEPLACVFENYPIEQLNRCRKITLG